MTEMVDGIMNALEAYTGDATINIKLITSVGGREDTLVKFEQTKYSDLKFFTCYFAPSFIRDALRLTVEYAQGDTTTHPLDANGQYLIPSFTIGNGGNTDYDFDTYRARRYVQRKIQYLLNRIKTKKARFDRAFFLSKSHAAAAL